MKQAFTCMRRGKKLALLAIALALLLGVLNSVLFPEQAQAASWGCEHNPVQINGTTYYACITLAQPCLRERNLLSFAIEGCLPYRSTIFVAAQFAFAGQVVNGSDIWDQIENGSIVSDDYVNTSNFDAYSPPIPSCWVIGGVGWIGGECW
jgi:hypothetical protein